MVLALSISERLTRARGDLRMGVPVVLCSPGGAALIATHNLELAARMDRVVRLSAGKVT